MSFKPDIHLIMEMYGSTFTTMNKTIICQDQQITEQNKTIAHQNKKITALEEEIIRLKEHLQLQQHHRFGKSSEVCSTTPEDEGSGQVSVSGHTRRCKKKKGRLLSTDHLPHFQKLYDLEESNKTCMHCQSALHLIKKNTSKQLEIIPLRYCVIEHIQFVYGCRCCNRVITPPKPPAPIPKAIAGASLLADIIVNKYHYHQPLYRQSKMMMNNNQLKIPDNTLGNWMINIGFALESLYQAMWCILKQGYLQVDETPVKILEPNKKGYLWTYYAPHIGNHRGLVALELSETRSSQVAEKRLAPFKGLLQTDGYTGYHALRKRKGITGLGCFTHARRKFADVVKITKDQTGIAAQMLERMKPLYQLEKRMKTLAVSFHTRKRLRQKIARPITQEIYRWLCSIRNNVPPKSKLGLAIQYTLNQWRYLVTYLRHGQAEIDTNEVENKIREIALGKKNWLFVGNKNSGVIHAIFYSLIISCTLNKINPRAYIHYVISKVHELRRGDQDPMTLLPHTIDPDKLSEFVQEQITFAQQTLDTS